MLKNLNTLFNLWFTRQIKLLRGRIGAPDAAGGHREMASRGLDRLEGNWQGILEPQPADRIALFM